MPGSVFVQKIEHILCKNRHVRFAKKRDSDLVRNSKFWEKNRKKVENFRKKTHFYERWYQYSGSARRNVFFVQNFSTFFRFCFQNFLNIFLKFSVSKLIFAHECHTLDPKSCTKNVTLWTPKVAPRGSGAVVFSSTWAPQPPAPKSKLWHWMGSPASLGGAHDSDWGARGHFAV